jgi:hypothetical protein
MSEPCPPAFIRTPPPTDPGTPTAHSKPARPAATVRRASTGSATAPPAVTTSSSIAMSDPIAESEIAMPLKPASATSRFDPRPTTSTGRSETRTAAAIRSRSAADRGRTNSAAEPPTL